jgi:AbrB family looped-hinge helix DNA binding protein
MKLFKVTSGGRVTIPAKLRQKYNFKPGTRVNFVVEGDGIKMIPLTKETIKDNAGFLKMRGKLLKSLMEEKKREREL